MEAIFGKCSVDFKNSILKTSSGRLAIMDRESVRILEVLYKSPNVFFDYQKILLYYSNNPQECTFKDNDSFMDRIERVRNYDIGIKESIIIYCNKYCAYASDEATYISDIDNLDADFEIDYNSHDVQRDNANLSNIAHYFDNEDRLILFRDIMLQLITPEIPREYVKGVLDILIRHNEDLLQGYLHPIKAVIFYKSVIQAQCKKQLKDLLSKALICFKSEDEYPKAMFVEFWVALSAEIDSLPNEVYLVLIKLLRSIVGDEQFCREQSIYCKDDIFLQVLQGKEGIRVVQRLVMVNILAEAKDAFIERLRESGKVDGSDLHKIAFMLQVYEKRLSDNNIDDKAFDIAIRDVLRILTNYEGMKPPSLAAVMDIFGKYQTSKESSRDKDYVNTPQTLAEEADSVNQDNKGDKDDERFLGDRKS